MFTSQTGRFLLAWTVILVTATVTSACPTCKESIAGNENLIRGYFWSIVFMMSMPFLIFGSLSAYMYHEVRKARAKREANSAS